ncbi:MAG: DUF4172 domain-containing protein [Hyphomicrobiales bacterium]|nr:DUF4172 domain-containing protein [Hyphomicrobiales bacterium]
MHWNWQRADWPHFSFHSKGLRNYEDHLLHSGEFTGVFRIIDAGGQETIRMVGAAATRTSRSPTG